MLYTLHSLLFLVELCLALRFSVDFEPTTRFEKCCELRTVLDREGIMRVAVVYLAVPVASVAPAGLTVAWMAFFVNDLRGHAVIDTYRIPADSCALAPVALVLRE